MDILSTIPEGWELMLNKKKKAGDVHPSDDIDNPSDLVVVIGSYSQLEKETFS